MDIAQLGPEAGRSRTAPDTAKQAGAWLVASGGRGLRFNGVRASNWQNVTAGFEIGTADRVRAATRRLRVGRRVRTAGWGARLPGTEQFALQGWDPERYGTLDHPGDDFSFDIYTQAARCDRPRDAWVAPRRASWLPAAVHNRRYGCVHTRMPFSQWSGSSTVSCYSSTSGRAHCQTPGTSIRRCCPGESCRLFQCGSATILAFPRWCSTARLRRRRSSPCASPTPTQFRLWEVAGTCHLSGGAGQAASAPVLRA